MFCLRKLHKPVSSFFDLTRTFATVPLESLPSIDATTRVVEGSRKSRNLRSDGSIPGVLYGPDNDGNAERILVQISERDFNKQYRAYRNSLENVLFNLKLDGSKEIKVTARDMQLDPVTDRPTCLNFLRFRNGRKLKIPVAYWNEDASPGLKRGGYINYIHRELECVCETEKIPESILVDLEGVEVGTRIRMQDLTFPEGIQPLITEKSAIVSTILGKKGPKPVADPLDSVADDDDEDDE